MEFLKALARAFTLHSKKYKTLLTGILGVTLGAYFGLSDAQIDQIVNLCMAAIAGFAAQDVSVEYRNSKTLKSAA